MTQTDIQNAIRGPLVQNMGNKLTPELIAGLLASLTESILKTMVDNNAQQS